MLFSGELPLIGREHFIFLTPARRPDSRGTWGNREIRAEKAWK